MRKPAAPTADLAGWCREQDRRMTAVETEVQWMRNLLALSRFAVPLSPTRRAGRPATAAIEMDPTTTTTGAPVTNVFVDFQEFVVATLTDLQAQLNRMEGRHLSWP